MSILHLRPDYELDSTPLDFSARAGTTAGDQACAQASAGAVSRSAADKSDPAADADGDTQGIVMIRKLNTGNYRLYSRRPDPKTGRRRNLGTFKTRAAAERHERAVQFFKRRG